MYEQEDFDSRLALIKGWRMNQECISEEMPSKGQMTKDTTYIGYKLVSTLVCLYGKRLENHFAFGLVWSS